MFCLNNNYVFIEDRNCVVNYESKKRKIINVLLFFDKQCEHKTLIYIVYNAEQLKYHYCLNNINYSLFFDIFFVVKYFILGVFLSCVLLSIPAFLSGRLFIAPFFCWGFGMIARPPSRRTTLAAAKQNDLEEYFFKKQTTLDTTREIETNDAYKRILVFSSMNKILVYSSCKLIYIFNTYPASTHFTVFSI